MANPQKEHGYTAVANEILEALALMRIPGEVRQVLDVIVRLTYGWHTKYSKISGREFVGRTGMNEGNIYRAIRRLVRHNLIRHCAEGYCLQKDYEKWLPFGKGGTVNSDTVKDDRKTPSKVTGVPLSLLTVEPPRKPCTGNGSGRPKESSKERLKKSLSLTPSDETRPLQRLTAERDKLERRIKTIFPQCVSIPKGIPTEKLFLFVYRLHQGEIRPGDIRSPVSYMKGMLSEDVGPFLQKMEAETRAKAAKAEKDRQNREAGIRYREENSAEMSQMIRDFMAQLEDKHAAGV
jgi:phage replication O-like protein O